MKKMLLVVFLCIGIVGCAGLMKAAKETTPEQVAQIQTAITPYANAVPLPFVALGIPLVALIAAIGNGTQGSTTGFLRLAGIESAGTKFTATGCSNSATVGGATAGSFTSGTTGTCTITISIGEGAVAPNGWSCAASDQTTPANLISQTTGGSTSTVVLTGTTFTGDLVSFHCTGY